MQQHTPSVFVRRHFCQTLCLELTHDALAQQLRVVHAIEERGDDDVGVIILRYPRNLTFQRLDHPLALLGARVCKYHIHRVRAVLRVHHAKQAGGGYRSRRLGFCARTADAEILRQYPMDH